MSRIHDMNETMQWLDNVDLHDDHIAKQRVTFDHEEITLETDESTGMHQVTIDDNEPEKFYLG